MEKEKTAAQTVSLTRLTQEETKHIQLEILDVVATFCEEHNIQYWLDSGTLLGAIRHKGYIPWDDDIDIGMLRPDFEVFMRTFNTENSRYHFICNELDASCSYPYGKVLDTETVLYEPDEKGIRSSVNIDIFVFDNAPENSCKLKMMYRIRDVLMMLNLLQNRMIGTHGPLKNFVKLVGYEVLRLFPKNYFASCIVKNAVRYAATDTGYVGNFIGISKVLCDKKIFDKMVKVEFEKKLYNAPVGYDMWLSAFYGDYMTLPPKEKQVSHHCYQAYRMNAK